MNKELDIINNHLAKNEYVKAEKISLDLTKQFPHSHLPYFYHGICCLSLNKNDEALASFKKGLSINPNDFGLNNNISNTLIRLEEYELAILHIKKSIEIQPQHPFAYMHMGEIEMKLRDFKSAVQSFDKSMELFYLNKIGTDDIPIHTAYAESLIANSQMEKLVNFYNKTQNSNFNSTLFYLMAGVNKNVSVYNNPVQIEEYLKRNNFSNLYQKTFFLSGVYFGLARYFEKENQKKSENYYHEGNKLIQSFQRFNLFQFQKNLIKVKQVYNKIKNNVRAENKYGDGIIFIVGMPRSGTTLLESIVASDNNVFSGGELTSLEVLFKNFISNFDEESSIKTLDQIAHTYTNRINFLKKDKMYFIDKLPENYIYMGLIKMALPRAKFIHINRDPWDNAISLYKQRYISNVHFSSSFFGIAIQLANHKHMIDFWKQNIPEASLNDFLFLNYEDLVSSPSTGAKLIDAFFGINVKITPEGRSNFFSNTASMTQVRSAIHQKSLKKNDFIEFKHQFDIDFEQQLSFWNTHNQ